MKIAIVGGGAAGLMSAAFAHKINPEAEIFLIERNESLGKKVVISGGGRCNVTTGIVDIPTILTRYPRGGKFLSSAMYVFPPDQVRDWFENHGVPMKTEDDLRVFPVSNQGNDIVRVFENLFQQTPVTVLLRTTVQRIEKHTEEFFIYCKDTATPLIVDRVILTTGGQAYRHTGSTGDGYSFAQSLGHTITQLAPSLNAFFTKETWPASNAGLSFQKATITAHLQKKYSYTGPFLFTHKGITGPAVFAVSSLVAFDEYNQTNPLSITIDLFPDLTSQQLTTTIEESILRTPKKTLPNTIFGILPKSLSENMCIQLNIPIDKKVCEISKMDCNRCVAWLKAIPLSVIARGAGDEFVTAGGVELTEVNPSTMESKICKGLFFAGEILNIDGFTGGFNLQSSWATGALAGECAATL